MAAVIGGAAYLLGGPIAAGWSLVAWGTVVVIRDCIDAYRK